jgi:hypothetical protein
VGKGFYKRKCPLCRQSEGSSHILLKSLESRQWKEQLFCRKGLIVIEDVACERINSSFDAAELKSVGKFLYIVYMGE